LFAAIERIDEVDSDVFKDVFSFVSALGRVALSCLSRLTLDVFLVQFKELVEFLHDVIKTCLLLLLLAAAESEAEWVEVFEGVVEIVALVSHVVLLVRRHACCVVDITFGRVGQSLVGLVD